MVCINAGLQADDKQSRESQSAFSPSQASTVYARINIFTIEGVLITKVVLITEVLIREVPLWIEWCPHHRGREVLLWIFLITEVGKFYCG